jgi:WS/DGAT/MGAT family acyltransferase
MTQSHYKYERLSAQDNDFLAWEKPNGPMHGGSTQIFSPGPLAREGGGIDFATIRRGIEGILHRIPRYRQRLAWVPGEQHAVWVDDRHFNLDYHLRHISVPRPGTDEQLKALVARLFERPLDRARPLWEIWVVEGLEGGRFATVGLTHHCMVDGAAGMDLARSLFSTTPEFSIREPHRYMPRPQPSDAELRRDSWLRLLGLPFDLAGRLREFVRETEDLPGEIVSRVRALGEMALWKAIPASDTPLNGFLGPHRRVDWVELRLDEIKAVRRALDCSVNDVVLAIVTGAVREFLMGRQVRPDGLEFRVAIPVNVRSRSEEGRMGNRVSTWIVRLPLAEEDPVRQIQELHRTTQELKESHQADAIELVEAVHEWIPLDIQGLAEGTQNMYVTNVPGPQFPLYLMGAKLQAIYLHAPLLQNQGLAVGALSYDGRVCWGFTADEDRLPDLDVFTAAVGRSFERLAQAAGVRLAAARPVEVRTGAGRKKTRKRRPPASAPATTDVGGGNAASAASEASEQASAAGGDGDR